MSDYERSKVLRVPFDKYVKGKSAWDFEDENIEHFRPDTNINRFDICCTDERTYIDYRLDYSYGEECGDFGFARKLTQREMDKYKPVFEKLLPNIDMNDVRYVDFCYYNCCEPADYYEEEEI